MNSFAHHVQKVFFIEKNKIRLQTKFHCNDVATSFFHCCLLFFILVYDIMKQTNPNQFFFSLYMLMFSPSSIFKIYICIDKNKNKKTKKKEITTTKTNSRIIGQIAKKNSFYIHYFIQFDFEFFVLLLIFVPSKLVNQIHPLVLYPFLLQHFY